TTAGTFEEYVEYPRGHYTTPLEKVDLLQKFAALAAPELSERKVEEIYDLVMAFDALDSLAPFFEAVRIR
ncbi:MAG: MmgE/PrpD family protein, partial [Candidatus Krumholzibacteria bacterium]|nr:MmgE/PrpD family protein [Candidatus Krumholzibacteria bacterium]